MTTQIQSITGVRPFRRHMRNADGRGEIAEIFGAANLTSGEKKLALLQSQNILLSIEDLEILSESQEKPHWAGALTHDDRRLYPADEQYSFGFMDVISVDA